MFENFVEFKPEVEDAVVVVDEGAAKEKVDVVGRKRRSNSISAPRDTPKGVEEEEEEEEAPARRRLRGKNSESEKEAVKGKESLMHGESRKLYEL